MDTEHSILPARPEMGRRHLQRFFTAGIVLSVPRLAESSSGRRFDTCTRSIRRKGGPQW